MATAFTDAAGRSVTLASLAAGRPLLLAPVQHHCPNLCGFTLAGLSGRLRETGLDRSTSVVALGIDPHETAADAGASAARLKGLAHADAVVGQAPAIAVVTHAIGYRYAFDPQLGQFAHAAATAVITPDGRLSSWLYGLQPPAEVVRAAVSLAAKGGGGSFGERLILLCYHFDAATGRYTNVAAIALRVAAASTALALAAFIGWSLLRERRRAAR